MLLNFLNDLLQLALENFNVLNPINEDEGPKKYILYKCHPLQPIFPSIYVSYFRLPNIYRTFPTFNFRPFNMNDITITSSSAYLADI